MDTYIIPLTRVEEATAYWTAYSLPAFIGCFMYPWKLSLATALGAKCAETFAIWWYSGIIAQSGFGQSWNQAEEQNAFYFQ